MGVWVFMERITGDENPRIMADVILQAQITCPHCAHASLETMPEDACLHFWECPSCGEVVKPKAGDCCVFCSYGEEPCPPVQKRHAE